jgi:hypothetical protein
LTNDPSTSLKKLTFSPLIPYTAKVDPNNNWVSITNFITSCSSSNGADILFNTTNDSYFSNGGYSGGKFQRTWAIRALLDWATNDDSLGYDNTTDAAKPTYVRGYNSKLRTHAVNFPFFYGPLMANFTATQHASSGFIDLGWLSIALIIGVAVAILYWRMDFK